MATKYKNAYFIGIGGIGMSAIARYFKFKGLNVLSNEEGGRHTPFFNNYRPQFYFRTTDVTGVITPTSGTATCTPTSTSR